MVAIANNPYTMYSTFVSEQRNMFLSSSVTVAMIGFSNTIESKLSKNIAKIVCLLIFSISIFLGLMSSSSFLYYLDNNTDKLPDYIPVYNWRLSTNVNYVYAFLMSVIAFIFLVNKVVIFEK